MLKLKYYHKILIIRPDRIGDLTLSLPVAETIKSNHPDSAIYYLASAYAAPLLKYCDYIDDFIPYTRPDGQKCRVAELIEGLEAHHFDLAIFLKADWLSAFAVLAANIKTRIGTSRRACSFLFNKRVAVARKKSGMHEIDLNLRLLEPLGVELNPGSSRPRLNPELKPWPNEKEYSLPAEYVVIHLGSKGSAANWPIDRYGELVSRLSERIAAIVTGQGNFPIAVPNQAMSLINKTNLDDLVNILSRAKLVISGGTGPLHLAGALGKPVIGFFPNRPHLSPTRWGPRTAKSYAFTALEQSGHSCRIRDNGSCQCMDSIKIDDVIGKALELLS